MEIWKAVIGYEGRYEVSDLGRVRSLLRDKILKPGLNVNGYQMVVLSKDKKYKTRTVHRIVITAFVPNVECKEQINHKNGIKTDNRLVNLEWCSASENIRHAIENGLYPKRERIRKPYSKRGGMPSGGRHWNAKSVVQFLNGVEVNRFHTTMEASKSIGVCHQGIANACRGVIKRIKGFEFKYEQQLKAY